MAERDLDDPLDGQSPVLSSFLTASDDDDDDLSDDLDLRSSRSPLSRRHRSSRRSHRRRSPGVTADALNDDEDDAPPYISPSKVSLTALSSVGNSKAILSALRSLQTKIRQLETERDAYRSDLAASESRCSDLTSRLSSLRAQHEAELSNVRVKDTEVEGRMRRLEESVSNSRKRLERYREELDVARRSQDEAQRECTQAKDERRDAVVENDMLKARVEQLEELRQAQSDKIEEMSRFVVRERRRSERLESQNAELEANMKDLVDVQRGLVQQKRRPRRRRPRSGRKKVSSSFTPRRRRTQQQGRNRTRNRSRRPVSSSGRILSGRRGGTMKKRLFRANLRRNVPFLPAGGNAKRTFNVNSLAQTALQVGITSPKREPRVSSTEGLSSGDEEAEIEELVGGDDGWLTNPTLQRNANRIVAEIRQEYDALVAEYETILARIRRGEGGSDGTRQLKSLAGLIRKKEAQLEQMLSFKDRVGSTLLSTSFIPKVKGAKKRIKTLKLFHNLKKVATEQ